MMTPDDLPDHLPFLGSIAVRLIERGHVCGWTYRDCFHECYVQAAVALKRFDPQRSTWQYFLWRWVPPMVQEEYLRNWCGRRRMRNAENGCEATGQNRRSWYGFRVEPLTAEPLAPDEPEPDKPIGISRRERGHTGISDMAIAQLLARGYSQSDAARILGVHPSTLNDRIQRMSFSIG